MTNQNKTEIKQQNANFALQYYINGDSVRIVGGNVKILRADSNGWLQIRKEEKEITN